MMSSLKDQFLLDPKIHYLNHGSFGACPRQVFEKYQAWQEVLETQPVKFLSRQMNDLLLEARTELAEYLNCSPEDLVYFPNPTTAINMVARSLDLSPGDEILSTNHEYGAMNRTWQFIAEKRKAKYINLPITLPLSSDDEIVETLWQGVTSQTKVIFVSHITSQTALKFPVEEICARARDVGILTVIDGAHAPGQIALDLTSIGADIYTGACHKWLCAPKGAAFLYAAKHIQDWLDPLVVSWGYQANKPGDSQFIDYHQWQGTRDLASFLTVPSAIQFQEAHGWDQVRANCREMLSGGRRELISITGMPEICPDSPRWWMQMAAIQLPELDMETLKLRLYDEFQVEVPIYRWEETPFLRVSMQGYNSYTDLEALFRGLRSLLPELLAG